MTSKTLSIARGPRASLRSMVIGAASLVILAILSLKIGVVDDATTELIVQLRLPRVILAIAVGAGLSVAGAVLQAIFANPICEPYTLGISSGAALGAILGTSFGLDLTSSGLAGSAFAGALLFALTVCSLSKRLSLNSTQTLLVGVMLGLLGSSLSAVWMALADSQGLQGILFWLLGDLSRARPMGSLFVLASVLSLIVVLWRQSKVLDALLFGEENARLLGIDVDRQRNRMILISSMLVGACVSASGLIGFVGLLVPHYCRRTAGSFHRALIPACALWGATTIVGGDLLARWISRPIELPVGPVVALIGVPLFFWVLRRPIR